MSRINNISRTSSPHEVAADDEADTMPSGLQKSKRSSKSTKRKAPQAVNPPSSQMRNAVVKGPAQQYLVVGDKTRAIENWNDNVPPKLARPADDPEESDPAIRAYLEAKMELFRTAGMVDGSYGGGNSEGSVSSRKS